jgi:mRNA interferase RelE/StbE
MAGEDDLWRIRVGSYRVVYTVRDDVLVVLVVKIGHRREVYRSR